MAIATNPNIRLDDGDFQTVIDLNLDDQTDTAPVDPIEASVDI
jgi:hypothetical protein